ncbi:MAG: NADH-quinone oxidoreductase subunit NuoE [Pseudomonadota bacterium]
MGARRFDLEAGGESFSFQPETEETIAFWRGKYPGDRQQSAVIPLLWLAQKDNGGWLSEPALREVADRLEMPYIRVYEVATFYTMFRLQPVGKNHIQLCGTTPCMLRGANDLKEVCASKIGRKMAVTDDGRLSWEEVECLGACVNAPMVQINDDYFEDLTPESFAEILERLRNGADVEPGPQIDRVNSEPAGGTEVLSDPSLFDGSRVASLVSLPNLKPPEPEQVQEPAEIAKSEAEKPSDQPGKAPMRLEAGAATPDDLQKIKGVGEVNARQLNDLGIFTYAQIAAWSAENIAWVEAHLKFAGRIQREDWVAQAEALKASQATVT